MKTVLLCVLLLGGCGPASTAVQETARPDSPPPAPAPKPAPKPKSKPPCSLGQQAIGLC